MKKIQNRPIINREFVEKSMEETIKIQAKKEGVSIEEYRIIRRQRKINAIQNGGGVVKALERVRKKGNYKKVEIIKSFDHNHIKGGRIMLQVPDKKIVLQAYINSRKQKDPVILGEMDKLDFAEKKSVRRHVYGYFSDFKRS